MLESKTKENWNPRREIELFLPSKIAVPGYIVDAD